MRVIYVRETKETCDFIKRIILKLKCFFNIINIEIVQEKIIYNIPIFTNKKISNRKISKLSKKIIKNLDEEGVYNIVLSKYLCTIEELKNIFYRENINILDGRYLFKCLSYELVEYILKIKNKKMRERLYYYIS